MTTIDLRNKGIGPVTRVLYLTSGSLFVRLCENLELSYFSTDAAGGFKGVTLGAFAQN